MGETIYDMDYLNKYSFGRLNDLVFKPKNNDLKQEMINTFLSRYNNGKKIEGKVKVWRGTINPHAVIRPGDFVTFDRGVAQSYIAGKYPSIITDVLESKDLIVFKPDVGSSELVYWPEGHQIQKYEGHVPTFKEFWEQYRFGI